RVPRARRRPAGPAHARASPRSARDRPPSPGRRGAARSVRGDRGLARFFGGRGGFLIRLLPISSQHRPRDVDPIERAPVLLVKDAFPKSKGPVEPPVPFVRRGEPDAHHEPPSLGFVASNPRMPNPLPSISISAPSSVSMRPPGFSLQTWSPVSTGLTASTWGKTHSAE